MAGDRQIYLDLAEEVKIPALGLGTWQALDENVEKAVDCALEAGYRHIDTAHVYENEKAIGRVLKKWLDSGKIKREDLFVVTKLPKHGNRPSGVAKYLQSSLDSLGLSYVDLYLVHSPFAFHEKSDGSSSDVIDESTDHVAIWKAMEDQVVAGKARCIGLSNFNVKQIEHVCNTAKRFKPVMLQVEVHLYHQQKELVDFCKSKNIKVCAYAPFGSRSSSKLHGKDASDVLNDEVVKQIAQKHNKTPGQILLRHALQRGFAVIPKSSNSERIQQNFQVFDFELSSEEMMKLDAQDRGEAARVFDFLVFKGVASHPEYPF